ncbi:MAG: hypothetical protein PVI79_17640 [Gammaproteobacteria bacterium]|jgi:hypothetical protein
MDTRSKLAVILHADVVGSTALVQLDERLAHLRIQDSFNRLSKCIAAYSGKSLSRGSTRVTSVSVDVARKRGFAPQIPVRVMACCIPNRTTAMQWGVQISYPGIRIRELFKAPENSGSGGIFALDSIKKNFFYPMLTNNCRLKQFPGG